MASFIQHTILQNDFILHHNRTVFWEQEKLLILSDLHLGKTGHFRKSGIAVPAAIMKEDMQRFIAAIQFFKPQEVVIVGDLFHSVENKEHELFLKWRNDLKYVPMRLVKGNHDIVPDKWYKKAGIIIEEKQWTHHQFHFVHQPEHIPENIDDADAYYFSGHLHPAISIKGLGKQSLRFPCFYFTGQYCVLPAFGKFTGTYRVEPLKNEQAFAIVENSVIPCS
ncbi:MAG: ligase-associated DNA damage response endonuclease PdeM [Bacteroidetes bacterium]|nr:ligase-associated DNA damage response endonuclease PdeM [Bacteroidota bacterium]